MATQVIPLIKTNTDPTSGNTINGGHPLGQHWFNADSGDEFIRKSDGVWVVPGSGGISILKNYVDEQLLLKANQSTELVEDPSVGELATADVHLAAYTDTAYFAIYAASDQQGNQIDTHYATQAELESVADEVDLKQTVFTGICQKQFLTENDIEIDTVNLLFKINTVKNGTAISDINPICFYTDGNGESVKHTISTPVQVSFTDTAGIWYFYFNSNGSLVASTSVWTDLSTIATVYRFLWNPVLTGADRCVIQSVEFHKNDIIWVDHIWKHNEGTKHVTGFDITASPTNGTPNANGANTCIALSTGKNIDDNLLYTVTNTNTPTAKFTQNLGTSNSIANGGKFICTYNTTTPFDLRKIAATDFPFLFNPTTNIPQYVTTSGVRTDVSPNFFFVYYIYALQDPQVGEAVKIRSAALQFANATLAAAHNWETLQSESTTLKDNEIRVLYKLTYEYRTGYDVAIKKAALRGVDDLRKQRTTTTAIAGGTLPATSISETNYINVQSAINALVIPQIEDSSSSGTVLVDTNTIKVLTTTLTNANTLTITPSAPTVFTRMNECTVIFNVGATSPTLTLTPPSGASFVAMDRALPSTLVINKTYTFVFLWINATTIQVYHSIKA